MRPRSCRGFVTTATLVLGLATAIAQTSAPKYEVDASWPKPLPNQWVLGGLGGVCVDNQDHVFILNRQDGGPTAPLIIEFDAAGNVVNSWGDPALLDDRLHSCHADADNNIWVDSSPSGMIQKYSHDGRTVLQEIGKKGAIDSSDGTIKGQPLNSNAPRFFMPASIFVDRSNGDVYVADGENGGNRRVVVLDRSGTFLRQWHPDGMQTVHCLAGTRDGYIYVCNRQQGRIQIYDKTGRFIRNIETGGSAVALDFSPDASQRWIFVINQENVGIFDRQSGASVGTFGRAGHMAGEFDQPHGIAVDSRANVYVAENRGKRVQKFVPVLGR